MGQKKKADNVFSVCVEPFDSLLLRLGIADWDWVLVGDGSGMTRQSPCGWACVATPHSRLAPLSRQVLRGGCDGGTSQLAEMMAYLLPLDWLCDQVATLPAEKQRKYYRVHIVTDSEYCCGRGSAGTVASGKHSALWAAFESFNRSGFLLSWHHVPRASVGLNIYTDHHSRDMRLRLDAAPFEGPAIRSNNDERLLFVNEFNP